MSSILSFTSSLFFQPKCNSWAKISKASPKHNDWLTYAGLVAIRLQLDFTDLLVDGEVSKLHVAPNVEVQSLAPANPTVLIDLHRLRHVVKRWGSGKDHDKRVEYLNTLLASRRATLDRNLIKMYLDDTYNGRKNNPIDWNCITQILTNQTYNLKIQDPMDQTIIFDKKDDSYSSSIL